MYGCLYLRQGYPGAIKRQGHGRLARGITGQKSHKSRGLKPEDDRGEMGGTERRPKTGRPRNHEPMRTTGGAKEGPSKSHAKGEGPIHGKGEHTLGDTK